MPHHFVKLAAAALTLAASTALAAEPVAVHGDKTVGAMTFATRGLAVTPTDVRRQGGFASAGAARWIRTPVVETQASAF